MPALFDLDRFVSAQASVYSDVIRELSAGRKRTHWMWFIFPQIAGLGQSETARYYSIVSRAEAVAYLEHPILGIRLRECTQLVINILNRPIGEIMGHPDDLKFRSSMTLFEAAAADNQVFRAAIDKYFEGKPDARTLDLLRGMVSPSR